MIRNSSFGPRLVREYNELNILRFIKNEGPISRADIAIRYKISKAAVSEIISHLLIQNYVFEIGVGNSTRLGGRRPIMLEFNPKAGYAIGVEIKRDHAQVALGDLNAGIHMSKVVEYRVHTPLKDIVQMLFVEIDQMMEQKWVRSAKGMGIGVAIPGVINYRHGRIEESDSLKEWQNFPLRKVFEDRYGVDTIIENDVKANSLAESRFGNGRGTQNQIYLWVGDGLGAGITINGDLYRGISAGAGEIGYMRPGIFITHKDDFKLLYKNQKNFGDLLSESELLKTARRLLNDPDLTILAFLDAVDHQNPVAIDLIREYAELISIVCINLVNTLNPELILIAGHETAQNKTMLKFVKEAVKAAVLKAMGRAVRIKSASLKNAGITGAIALILEDIFYMERLNISRYRDVFGFKR